jgi:integrase/recombinase XerD
VFQSLLRTDLAYCRHRDGLFAVERERYLRHCADRGATVSTLRMKSNELLWAARLLSPSARRVSAWASCSPRSGSGGRFTKDRTTGQRFVDYRETVAALSRVVARAQKLRFPLRPTRPVRHMDAWMRDERGFSASTIVPSTSPYELNATPIP